MKCSFCGFVFDDADARRQCQGCLIVSGCRSVRCTRCGYEMPEELGFLKRLGEWREKMRVRRNAAAPSGDAGLAAVNTACVAGAEPSAGAATAATPIPLAGMQPGDTGLVVDIRSGGNGQMQKCLALGILPGVPVTLRKRSPSFIFDIGFSQFAVDEGMASAVLVQVNNDFRSPVQRDVRPVASRVPGNGERRHVSGD